MRKLRDALVSIDPDGSARPLGETARQRLAARSGTFEVLPAPAHMVMMRQAFADPEGAGETRRCLLAGEITGPGALCDVASFVGNAGHRGELIVLAPDASRSIYFDQGHVVAASSTVERERLGPVLLRYGVLTEPQVASCSEAVASRTMRFGEAAVRLGYVTREKLFGMMAHQAEEIFYGTVLVGEGMFYFLESFEDAALSSRHKLATASLIREGVRRMHETRHFRVRIPSDLHVPARAPGREPPEPDPLGVHAHVDGSRSIAELCRLLGAGEFELTRAVFQLVQSGDVVIKPPARGTRQAVEVYNRAVAYLLRELDAIDEGDAVREQLAVYTRKDPGYGAIFAGAGPSDDGTLDADQVAENLARAGQGREAEERLGRLLYEHAAYALFLARPPMRRAREAIATSSEPPRPSERPSVRVARMLEALATPSGATGAPPRRVRRREP